LPTQLLSGSFPSATAAAASVAAGSSHPRLTRLGVSRRAGRARTRLRLKPDTRWRLAPSARLVDDHRVLVIFLLGFAPLLMWLTLAIALYLTVIELREMQPAPHYLWWSWWLLLVFMTHFVGYLILRAYAVYRRWNTRSG